MATAPANPAIGDTYVTDDGEPRKFFAPGRWDTDWEKIEGTVTLDAPSHGMNAATLAGQGFTRGKYDGGTVRLAATTEDHDVLMLGVVDDDTLSIALPHHAYQFPLLAPILDTLGPQTLLYRSNTADGAWSDPISGDAIAIYHGDGWIETLVAPDTHPPVTTATVFDNPTPFAVAGTNVWTDVGAFIEQPGDILDIAYGAGDLQSFPLHGDGTISWSFRPSATTSDKIEARVFGGQLQVRSNNGGTGISWVRVRRSLRVMEQQVLTNEIVQFEAGLSDGNLLKLDTTTTPWTLRQELIGGVERVSGTVNRDFGITLGPFQFRVPVSNQNSLQHRYTGGGSTSLSRVFAHQHHSGMNGYSMSLTSSSGWQYFWTGLNMTAINQMHFVEFEHDGWVYELKFSVAPSFNQNPYMYKRTRM